MKAGLLLVHLAWKSLASRRATAGLTVLSLTVSVALLLGVETLHREARSGFAGTVSGTDLIVGARSGPIALLLHSVFRVGDATANISWTTAERIAAHPDVAWTVPLSLGDSHRGYRVVGTNADYFHHYRYGKRQSLAFKSGGPFEDTFDAVLGAEVAQTLGYRLGDDMVVAHGLGEIASCLHDDHPFRVAGILAPTGTPVDRAVHVSLAGIEAMHFDWQPGTGKRGPGISSDQLRRMDLQPKEVTALLVGLKSRFAVFRLQREINTDRSEPLLAILPGATLAQLWGLMGNVETALRAISALVAAAAFLGMLSMLLAGLTERQHEIAVLRAVGAQPWQVISLIVCEALVLTLLAILFGLVLLHGGLAVARPLIAEFAGVRIGWSGLEALDFAYLAGFLAIGFLAGLPPSLTAYRRSLADGLIPRR